MESFGEYVKGVKLNSGLSIYLVSNRNTTSNISVCLLVKAGSAFERQGERGWFHFLEHLSIYPSLYKSIDETSNLGKFLAFDYAYTSFYETAFWFHASDETGELLLDSLKTMKGILCGNYIKEEAFAITKRDVITEYNDYEEKIWFKECNRALKSRSICMPVGEKADITKAVYADMLQMQQQYYRNDNAAILIRSAMPMEQILQFVSDVFDVESHVYLAWIKRIEMQQEVELIHRYMELAIVARAIEMIAQGGNDVEQTECSITIFNEKFYLIKLEAMSYSQIKFNNFVLSKDLFESARQAVKKQLNDQYDITNSKLDNEEILMCCREHFLFGEPILCVENEEGIYLNEIQRCVFDKVKIIFDETIRQFEDCNNRLEEV